MDRRSFACVRALVLSASVLAGCSSSPAVMDDADRRTLASASAASLDGFLNEDPSLRPLLDRSVGFAVFPDVGKAGFIAGGSYGKGEVFQGGFKIGYADVSQATVGLQAGAQSFDELIVFMRRNELNEFKGTEFKLAGNISVVAIKSGAAATVDTDKGVVAFVRTKGGLMAEAAIGGQRFRFSALGAK